MSRALDFFRKNKAQNTIAAPPAARSDVGEKNNLIRAPERLKSSPSSPSYPESNGVLAPGGPDAQASRLARPQPEPAPPASGNSGNSGNFLAGSPRENRNFCETDAAPPGTSGHKDAIDALRQLKNAGATVTWDGRGSRVSFEAVSGADPFWTTSWDRLSPTNRPCEGCRAPDGGDFIVRQHAVALC